jgi:HD-like signal output (HDOD) protein/CheY-like chemotaxis protein
MSMYQSDHMQERAPSGEAPIVVFVDDEEPILASLRSLFRHAGYVTSAFVQTSAALEYLKRVPAALVISDLRMPAMTGIEFLNEVSSINPNAIRVMLSGYEDKRVVMDALSNGLAHHYVMKPWVDSELRDLVHQALEKAGTLRRRRLETVLKSIESLPSPPTYHQALRAMLAQEGSSIKAISRELEKSPPIVAKLLRVANSVYFSSRKPITTVTDAVFFIGTEYISGLVAGIEAFHGFAGQSKAEVNEQIEALWSSSFQRASIAKWIAETWTGFAWKDLAFTVSLLQDIGYAVLLCVDPEGYERFSRIRESSQLLPIQLEEEIFGHSHAAIGAALLEYWNLPPMVVSGVAKHHQVTEGVVLFQVLQLADVLCNGLYSTPHDPAIEGLLPAWEQKFIAKNESSHPANPER